MKSRRRNWFRGVLQAYIVLFARDVADKLRGNVAELPRSVEGERTTRESTRVPGNPQCSGGEGRGLLGSRSSSGTLAPTQRDAARSHLKCHQIGTVAFQ
jgi:hypothetical protein